MVIDLQITSTNNCAPSLTNNIKANLLSTNEVTFLNVDDGSEYEIRRKRLTTISTETSDVLSVDSSIIQCSKKKIPDGGYGWVIVFASLMVSLIADGISFSFGLLYTELLDYFDEGVTKTAWVGSLFMAVPLLAGPIMSNLVDKYGCQKMTMIGGVLGCTGFVLSAVSNSVEILFFTFGIVSGLGLGVIYVTAVVSIAFWFESKRTFATGIGASGTGLGTFLYAPFTHWLIETYGWRGATLILGGTLLNFCVFGALMIDPDWLIEENKLQGCSQSIQTFSNSSTTMCLDEIKKLLETGADKEDVLDTLVTNVNTEANLVVEDPDILILKKYKSELLLPTFISSECDHLGGIKSSSIRSLYHHKFKSPETISRDELLSPLLIKLKSMHNDGEHKCNLASFETLNSSEKVSSNEDLDTVSLNVSLKDMSLEDFSEMPSFKRSGKHGSRFSLDEKMIRKPSTSGNMFKGDLLRNFRGYSLDVVYENETFQLSHQSCNENKSDLLIPAHNNLIHLRSSSTKHRKQLRTIPVSNLKRNPSLRYSNYLKNMRVHRNSIHYRGAMLNTHRYRLKASSCPNIYRNSMTTIAREDDDVWYDDFVDIIKSIFDFSLFLQYKFGMMSLSTLFLFVWYIIPYFYITELLLNFDYSEESSAYLISAIGIFNTLGVVGLGWVGDQKWCNVTKTYAFCLVLCGLSMYAIPLATSSYTALVILCSIFGVTFGSSFSFTPIITSRLVEIEDFTLAYGLILLVQGIGSLVGPPLAGFIFTINERWDDSFYVGGVFVALSGVLAYIIGELKVEVSGDDEDVNNNDDRTINTK
ncbi:CLUMA_CG021268, isoform A [Clunio marinus]|uniref:CLUMA_CG021268, isoform A n=1 Tax=Clunio marinus TaxID=568069 RepID=A0A1J1JCD2_9DIPT|nr:CLUMA_CG021268, isoform A [Clunio marinus]